MHQTAWQRALVHEVDVGGPETTCPHVLGEGVHVELEGVEVAPAEHELLNALEEQLPLGGEAEYAEVEQADADRQVQCEVLHLAEFQQYGVPRLGRREAVGALQKLARGVTVAHEVGETTNRHEQLPQEV